MAGVVLGDRGTAGEFEGVAVEKWCRAAESALAEQVDGAGALDVEELDGQGRAGFCRVPAGPDEGGVLGLGQKICAFAQNGGGFFPVGGGRDRKRDILRRVQPGIVLEREGEVAGDVEGVDVALGEGCLLYTSPSPRDS